MPPEAHRIGLIEDDPVMGESLIQRLNLEGYETTWWQSGKDACNGLKEACPDLVICDLRLPDLNGDEIFRKIKLECFGPPFLFITAYGQINQAVELMRAGAGDYVTKPFEMQDFLGRVETLLAHASSVAGSTGKLGVSPAMREVELLLTRLTGIHSTILLSGETGVGKEVAARFLHENSANKDKPFMAVNCAAIPSELIESEIFGHEKGAFTNARERHLGYAERAQDGVLFLDEIGDLSLPAQTKILRLLQERVFTRVGGEEDLPFSARVICATNADLNQLAEGKTFRRDLYYRINVIPVYIAPLRKRSDDIVPLIGYYIAFFNGTLATNVHGLTSLAEEAALSYDWPGNVRELRNRVERAVALAVQSRLGPSDLFPELGQSDILNQEETLSTLAQVRDAAERRQIMRALEKTGGQTGRAAALLAVSRTTLWEKMRRLDLSVDDLV